MATKLSAQEIKTHLALAPGWKKKGGEIYRTFDFKNFYETMAFVNAVAYIANLQNHHPDLEVGYNKCTVRYSTHSVGGLSKNDFAAAGKVNSLV